MKANTDKGYISKPKAKKGYKIESHYCECGCKKAYYHYVKVTTKRVAKNRQANDNNGIIKNILISKRKNK